MAADPGAARLLVLHGPNLSRLGEREPHLYGSLSLDALNAQLRAQAGAQGIELRCEQHNGEGELISSLHAAGADCRGVIFNPGGYTHTSVAIHDAIRAISIPVVEVHLTNLYKREDFRHRSLTGAACVAVVMGFGARSYALALRELIDTLSPAA